MQPRLGFLTLPAHMICDCGYYHEVAHRLQVAMGWEDQEFRSAAAAALEDDVVDRQTLERVAAARGMKLETA